MKSVFQAAMRAALRGRGERISALLLLVLLASRLPASVNANAEAQLSDPALLKSALNPLAETISVPVLNTTNFNAGPNGRAQNVLSLEPVLPMELNAGWLLVTRILQPIPERPQEAGAGRAFGLGDMNPSFYLSPRRTGALVWGAGPSLVIPTATSDAIGQGKLSLGPAAGAYVQPGAWSFGVLASNVWSVAGAAGRPAVNRMSLQYSVSYVLRREWYLTSSPEILADWRAAAGDVWTIPFGMGAGKLLRLRGRPVDLSATFYRNAATPSGASNWSMILQMEWLFPRKR